MALPNAIKIGKYFIYRKEFFNAFRVWNVDKIEQYQKAGSISSWVEVQAWGVLVYRFETRDNGHRCRLRTRYINGNIVTGVIDEIEDSCSDAGPTWAITIRGTI